MPVLRVGTDILPSGVLASEGVSPCTGPSLEARSGGAPLLPNKSTRGLIRPSRLPLSISYPQSWRLLVLGPVCVCLLRHIDKLITIQAGVPNSSPFRRRAGSISIRPDRTVGMALGDPSRCFHTQHAFWQKGGRLPLTMERL